MWFSTILELLHLAVLEVGLLGVKHIGSVARNPSTLAASCFEMVLLILHIIFLWNEEGHFNL